MSGVFGYIFQSADGTRVYKMPHGHEKSSYEYLQNELYILKYLSTKQDIVSSIPVFYGSRIVSEKGVGLQMEKLQVRNRVFFPRFLRSQLSELKEWISSCFRQLEKLHRYILHMDLHSDNIMFRAPAGSKYPQIVFIDYGTSVTMDDLAMIQMEEDSRIVMLFKEYEKKQLRDFLASHFRYLWNKKILKEIVVHNFSPREHDQIDKFHDRIYRLQAENFFRRPSLLQSATIRV